MNHLSILNLRSAVVSLAIPPFSGWQAYLLTYSTASVLVIKWRHGVCYHSRSVPRIEYPRPRHSLSAHPIVHRLEDFRVFAQTVALKPRLGDLASILVAARRIKLAKPTLVFPTRRADIHAFGGKRRRLFFIRSRSKVMSRNCGFPRAVSTLVKNKLALLQKISERMNRLRQLVRTAASYPPAPLRNGKQRESKTSLSCVFVHHSRKREKINSRTIVNDDA